MGNNNKLRKSKGKIKNEPYSNGSVTTVTNPSSIHGTNRHNSVLGSTSSPPPTKTTDLSVHTSCSVDDSSSKYDDEGSSQEVDLSRNASSHEHVAHSSPYSKGTNHDCNKNSQKKSTILKTFSVYSHSPSNHPSITNTKVKLEDENSKLLYIHEQDANDLNIQSHDEMLVFQVHSDSVCQDFNPHSYSTNHMVFPFLPKLVSSFPRITFEEEKEEVQVQGMHNNGTVVADEARVELPRLMAVCQVRLMKQSPPQSQGIASTRKDPIHSPRSPVYLPPVAESVGKAQLGPASFLQRFLFDMGTETRNMASPQHPCSWNSSPMQTHNSTQNRAKEEDKVTMNTVLNTPMVNSAILSKKESPTNSKFSFTHLSPPKTSTGITQQGHGTFASSPGSFANASPSNKNHSFRSNQHKSKTSGTFAKNNKTMETGYSIAAIPLRYFHLIQDHSNAPYKKKDSPTWIPISFLGEAASLTLDLVSNPISGSIERKDGLNPELNRTHPPVPIHGSSRTLELLVLAYTNRQYVSVNDVLVVSVQGKRVEFKIRSIEEDRSKKYYFSSGRKDRKATETSPVNGNTNSRFHSSFIPPSEVVHTESTGDKTNYGMSNLTTSDADKSKDTSYDLSSRFSNICINESTSLISETLDALEPESLKSDCNTLLLFSKPLSQNPSFDQLQEHSSRKGPLLFRISYDTRVNFSFLDKSHSIEFNSHHSSSTSRTGTSHSLPQEENDTFVRVPSIHTLLSSSTRKATKKTQLVAGLDRILKNIHSILTPPLFHTDLFPRSGPIRAPRGVLVHGQSGTGKSLLARQVALDLEWKNENQALFSSPAFDRIISEQKRCHVEWVSCSFIQSLSSVMGEAERQLTHIFEKADMNTVEGISTLIILDDVDLICPRRNFDRNGSGSIDRVASTLLSLLDGIGHNFDRNHNAETLMSVNRKLGNVVVLSTTSNPMKLDSAFRRSGRVDKEVEVPIPDERTKTEIFSFLLRNLECEVIKIPPLSDADLMTLSSLAKGFTGADCALCVKEACRDAILQSNHGSEQEHNDRDSTLRFLDLLQRKIKLNKPSTIKSITVEVPHVPWSSIGGMIQVKQQLREAIDIPLKYSSLFKALKIPPPRGILLYGPPGCSKTLMARALATEGNMNFLAVKGPELLSKWLGESERALASLFRRARMASPCVIFFDEIDAIGSKRGMGDGSSGGDRLLSQLLTELDGVGTSHGTAIASDDGETGGEPRVIIIGATNRPDLLDSALIRPGRIDKMIFVGLPDRASREDIFKVTLLNKACDNDVDIHELASENMSDGFSGAEIVSICQEAALYAIEEYDLNTNAKIGPVIHRRHLLRSINGTKRQITPQMLTFYESFHKRME